MSSSSVMGLAELHLHLEGSIDAETLAMLDPSVTPEEVEQAYRFSDFAGFIDAFKWVSRKLRGPADYATVTAALCRRLEREGIAYAEVTLAAGVVLWKQQDLPAVYAAVRNAASESNVEVRWNLDSIRQFGADLAWQVAEFAAGQVGNGVVSIGIGGDEVAGPVTWFGQVYRWAHEHRLRLTAHAGETAGPESVWDALAIGAHRIGHGIRSMDDPVLVRHLADRQIPLEVSITSNIRTGAVRSLEEHPLRRLFDAGVPITLNTDDPAMFATTLENEYRIAREHFGFNETELAVIRENAWRYLFSMK